MLHRNRLNAHARRGFGLFVQLAGPTATDADIAISPRFFYLYTCRGFAGYSSDMLFEKFGRLWYWVLFALTTGCMLWYVYDSFQSHQRKSQYYVADGLRLGRVWYVSDSNKKYTLALRIKRDSLMEIVFPNDSVLPFDITNHIKLNRRFGGTATGWSGNKYGFAVTELEIRESMDDYRD